MHAKNNAYQVGNIIKAKAFHSRPELSIRLWRINPSDLRASSHHFAAPSPSCMSGGYAHGITCQLSEPCIAQELLSIPLAGTDPDSLPIAQLWEKDSGLLVNYHYQLFSLLY